MKSIILIIELHFFLWENDSFKKERSKPDPGRKWIWKHNFYKFIKKLINWALKKDLGCPFFIFPIVIIMKPNFNINN